MASKHIPWDAFSSVPRDASKLELSDDEDEFAVKTGEITLTEPADPRARAHESAQAASKPGETAIVPSNGWVPGTLGKPGYQRILTDEEMNAGGGMGAMDLDDWKVTAMEKVHEGTTLDASGGAKTIMKTLLEAGEGTDTAHWPVQVEVTYTGKVRELGDTGAEGGVFDEEHATTPCIFDLRERFDLQVADARFDVIRPVGLMRGIGTMKLGERSRLTLKPEMGFGAEGDASLGVPESATLEYEVRVHRLIKTQVWEDGAIYKRRLITGPAEVKRDCAGRGLQLHTPQPNAEVMLRWGGALEEDGFEFRAQAEQQFWLGDPAFPDFWPRFLNSFRVGETSEVTLTSDLAFGDDGSMEHEVPPEAPVRLTITLLDFVPIADLSDKAPAPLEPRSALKRVTQRGRGFRYASFRYACALELSARRLEGPGLAGVQATRAAASAPLLDGVSLVHTCGAVHGAGSAELAAQEEVRAACGGADLAAALELLLPTMELYEEAELQCAPGWVGGAHEHGILLRVKLRSWVRVDPIEATGGAVWKTVLAESEAAEVVVPNLESRVSVRYSVRSSPGEDGVSLDLFASGETPVEFTQGAVRGGREILPCIDASITSFRVGEYARLECPPEFGYGAPLFNPPAHLHAHAGTPLLVDVECVSCVPAKHRNDLTLADQMGSQHRRKEDGNALWSKGACREAMVKWQASIDAAPHKIDLRRIARPGVSDEEKEAEVRAMESLKVSTHLNLSLGFLRSDQPQQALEQCAKALELHPDSNKAVFRRAQAKMMVAPVDVEAVRADLMSAARRDPQNREIRHELEKLKEVEAAQRSEDKSIFGGMFAKDASADMHEQD